MRGCLSFLPTPLTPSGWIPGCWSWTPALKSPTIIVLLSISPFMSVSVCLMYWGAPVLGECCYVTSVVSNSMQPHRRWPTRLPRPWDSPGKNTGVGCHFLLQCMKGKSESEVAQSCLTLRDPMVCSLPGSSVHGIFQARVLEWGAIAFSCWEHSYLQLLCFPLGLIPWSLCSVLSYLL